jgi:very-short-patch-repair endonuclease
MLPIARVPYSSSREAILKARMLRFGMTDAEERLWSRIRGNQLDGYRFRRQVPIGQYIVDFACKSAHLAIELDGGQHATAADADATRTEYLQSRGFRVLRFWDNDVLKETDAVLEAIRVGIKEPPSKFRPPPYPPP